MRGRGPGTIIAAVTVACGALTGCTQPPLSAGPPDSGGATVMTTVPTTATTTATAGCQIVSSDALNAPSGGGDVEFISVVSVVTAESGDRRATDEVVGSPDTSISWTPAPPATAMDSQVIEHTLSALTEAARLPLTADPASLTRGFALDSSPFDVPGEYVLYAAGAPTQVQVTVECGDSRHVATVTATDGVITGALRCGEALPQDAITAQRAQEYCPTA